VVWKKDISTDTDCYQATGLRQDLAMSKVALKLLLTTSTLSRRHARIDWVWRIAVFSTLVTAGLIALYLVQRGQSG
jgi:hypothetical protein